MLACDAIEPPFASSGYREIDRIDGKNAAIFRHSAVEPVRDSERHPPALFGLRIDKVVPLVNPAEHRRLLAALGADSLDGVGSVKMRSLRWDDDKVSAAHRIARHHGCCALQIHDDERGSQRCRFDDIDSRLLRCAVEDCELFGFARKVGPLAEWPVRVGIDHRYGSAVPRQFTC